MRGWWYGGLIVLSACQGSVPAPGTMPSPVLLYGEYTLTEVNGRDVPASVVVDQDGRTTAVRVTAGWITLEDDGRCEWQVDYQGATRRTASWGGRCRYEIGVTAQRRLVVTQVRGRATYSGWIDADGVVLEVNTKIFRFALTEAPRSGRP